MYLFPYILVFLFQSLNVCMFNNNSMKSLSECESTTTQYSETVLGEKEDKSFNRTNSKRDATNPIDINSTASTERFTASDDKTKHVTLSEVESTTVTTPVLYTAREYNKAIDGDEPQEPVFRIVNGTAASATDVPFQVSFRLLKSKKSKKRMYWVFCGGALISRYKILTAAHCFDQHFPKTPCGRGHIEGKDLSDYLAVAGNLLTTAEYKRNDSTESGQWRRLKNLWYPSKYKFPNNDIAVATVTRRFRYNDYVKPVNYTYHKIDWVGKCEASGFGQASNIRDTNVKPPANLQKAILELIPTSACRRYIKSAAKFVCVTTGTTKTDIGSGDSGGPLVCKGTKDPRDSGSGVLVGITCGTSYKGRRPVVSFFTNVGYYRKFIYKSNTSLLSPNLILLPSVCLFLYYTACS